MHLTNVHLGDYRTAGDRLCIRTTIARILQFSVHDILTTAFSNWRFGDDQLSLSSVGSANGLLSELTSTRLVALSLDCFLNPFFSTIFVR